MEISLHKISLINFRLIKTLYSLTKPGIVYGNALTCAAGFFLAAQGHLNVGLLIAVSAGLSLVIASACVCNNYIDRDIDALMERTKRRALAVRSIPAAYALFFAFVLGVGGVALLYFYTNVFTLLSALVGFFIYVAVYGYAKRHMQFAVHLGALAGATPPLVGYTAVSQQVDTIGIALFTLLMVWQMPHFLSIAIYRAHEYKTAGIYVFPLRQGVSRTKWLMLAYVVLFAFAVLALAVVAPVGQVYFLTMTLLCLGWLMLSMQGFFVRDDNRWARRMFLYSLVVITLLCLVLIV